MATNNKKESFLPKYIKYTSNVSSKTFLSFSKSFKQLQYTVRCSESGVASSVKKIPETHRICCACRPEMEFRLAVWVEGRVRSSHRGRATICSTCFVTPTHICCRWHRQQPTHSFNSHTLSCWNNRLHGHLREAFQVCRSRLWKGRISHAWCGYPEFSFWNGGKISLIDQGLSWYEHWTQNHP